MVEEFNVAGNRPHIRTENEMAIIDKDKADAAFKENKKIILEKYLISNGFVKYKTNSYVRKNKIDVLEYIDLQKERYGSKTFTVNYSIMPLYVPHDYLTIGFGARLGELICGKDIWWDYANDDIAQVSFQNVLDAIDRFLLPWFEKYSDEKILMEKLLEDKKKREQIRVDIPYKNNEWIFALKKCDNRNDIISENINKLKLPKRLIR